MLRLLNIAVAQVQPRKGDYTANVARVGGVLASMVEASPRPAVVHLPETTLSGYFVEGGVSEVAVTSGTLANDLDAAYSDSLRTAAAGGRPLDVVIGFYERWRETLYNSVAYVRLGDGSPQVLHVHRKAFLPTYGLFDEERFVERGHDLRAFDTPWGRAAMLICEDAWHSLSGTIVALDNAEVVFISTATPARGAQLPAEETPGPANVARWERLMRDIAEEHGIFVSLANLVGSEGGKVFAGCSCVFGPRGDLRVRGPAWEEAVMLSTLDLTDIRRARSDTPLLADLRTALPHLQVALEQAASEGPREGVGFDPASPRASCPSSRGAGPPPLSKIRPMVAKRPSKPFPSQSFPRRRKPSGHHRWTSIPRWSRPGSCASCATRCAGGA
jgi:predicted amidohydrolase